MIQRPSHQWKSNFSSLTWCKIEAVTQMLYCIWEHLINGSQDTIPTEMLQLITIICICLFIKNKQIKKGLCEDPKCYKCVIVHVFFYSGPIWLAVLTGDCSIVSDISSQVQRLIVNVQLLHTADKLPSAKREVVWYVGNSTQKQRTSQIQRPERGGDKEEEE